MDRDRIAEMLAAFGPVKVRRMFGGFGIYADDVMFALAHDGELYLKTDRETCAAFEREGQGAFSYVRRDGRRAVMSYWRVPDRLYDDADELAAWARIALSVARRGPAQGRVGSRRRAVASRHPRL